LCKERKLSFRIQKAVSRDGVGSYLLLPQGTKQMISLVTGLMYEFDNGTIPLSTLSPNFFLPTLRMHPTNFCDASSDLILMLLQGV
jgi:hypothetical protein